jgi:hypothetical protein
MGLAWPSDQREEERKSLRPDPRGKRKKRTGFGSHRRGEKGRPVAASDEARLQPCGPSSIARNTGAAHLQRKTQKSGQVLVRTREDKTESIDYFKGVCQEF